MSISVTKVCTPWAYSRNFVILVSTYLSLYIYFSIQIHLLIHSIEIFKCEIISEAGVADLIRSSKSSLSRVNIWNNAKLDHDIKTLEAALDLIRHVDMQENGNTMDNEEDDSDGDLQEKKKKKKKSRRHSSPSTIANVLKTFFGGKKSSKKLLV